MPAEVRKKRCICGRSTRMPLCDGSHKEDGWRCGVPSDERASLGFAASHSLSNLAERLAHRFGGVALHRVGGDLRCERLVLLTDGQDVAALAQQTAQVVTDERSVVAVGIPAEVIQWAFPDASCVGVDGGDSAQVWSAVERALEREPPEHQRARPRPRVFLSHATADEGRLLPLIEGLRGNYQLDVFVCADSIRSGEDWQKRIDDALRDSDLFLFVNSAVARDSTFCAFEAGLAVGKEKPLHVLSLDGAALPMHLQHLQALDVERLRMRRPWLSPSDAILEAMLSLLLVS